MPIAHEYEYFKPSTLSEAVELMNRFGASARCLAGGTDLVVHLKENIVKPAAVVNIKAVPELAGLSFKDNELRVGAHVTFSELMELAEVRTHFSLLAEASATVASVGVRNRATLVGNICSAVPSLDAGPALLVYNAEVVLEGPQGERTMSIHDWFTGPKKTARAPNEIVKWVSLKKPSQKHAAAYAKLGRYRGEDLAQAGVAVLMLAQNEYRVALCALGPVAKRAHKVEALLNGSAPSNKLFEEAAKAVLQEISPITDVRASKEYREHMAVVMTRRALEAAAARFAGHLVDTSTLLGG
jgi:carbon-monoxide dehydrogenase medium subunit